MAKNIEWKKSNIDYDQLNQLTPHHLRTSSHMKALNQSGKLVDSKSKGGKKTGKQHVESGHWANIQKIATKSSIESRVNAALKRKMVITNQLPLNEEFTSAIVRKLCEEANEHHNFWKSILNENKLIKRVHHGPNQFNPSRYIRIA